MNAGTAAHLARARDHARFSRWDAACAEYAAADAEEPLAVEDLEAFAEAAQISAHGDEAATLLCRLFESRVTAGELDDAAQVAFWLWWVLLNANKIIQANGWVQHASRILGPELPNSLWLKIPEAMLAEATGNRPRASELLEAIVDTGRGEVIPWALSLWGLEPPKTPTVERPQTAAPHNPDLPSSDSPKATSTPHWLAFDGP